ncbi:MAG: hypothetical protein HYZ75_02805 [Elusimicrobia bacterium]|nr:hypothetical protein [Elusimicrobiota bacterium]
MSVIALRFGASHCDHGARAGKGETIFETLLDIISYHTKGGAESQDGVELELS